MAQRKPQRHLPHRKRDSCLAQIRDHPIQSIHSTRPQLPRKGPRMYEMRATQPFLEQQTTRLIGWEISQPRKPIDRSLPSCLVPGNTIQRLLPASTRSVLTSPSWSSLAPAEVPHAPNAGSEAVKKSEISSPADPLAYRSELEAEVVEEGEAVAANVGSDASARRTERAALDRI